MKKMNVVFLLKTAFILAVCLFVFACNQNGLTDGREFTDVTISIGGLQGENQHIRAIGDNGLPDLTAEDTKITITATYNGTTKTANKKALTIEKVPVGTEIAIKVEVKTAYASWEGGKRHIVTNGENAVPIKLSKTAKSASNFLMSGDIQANKALIKLGDKKVFDGDITLSTLCTARDGLGRLYLAYDEPTATAGSATVITRFTVEGERDTAFEAAFKEAVKKVLPSGISSVRVFAVDFKTGDIFWLEGHDLYCVTKNGNNFTCLKYGDQVHNEVFAFAAIDGKLFCIEKAHASNNAPKLKAYKVSTNLTANTLDIDHLPGEAEPAIAINNLSGSTPRPSYTLFADDKGIYCLQSLLSLMDWGKLYSVGKLLHYEYDGSAFSLKKEVGLNPNGLTHNALPYHDTYFSNPIAFIGFDAENIYIADDGINIADKNENYRIVGNKNRIAAYSRNEGTLSFEDTAVSWFSDYSEYKEPETPILLWEKNGDAGGVGKKYWIGTKGDEESPVYDGSSSEVPENLLAYSYQTADKPTDIFCYDQDAALYIARYRDSNYAVKCYLFDNENKKWNSTNSSEKNGLSNSIKCIAVDISYGEKYLYAVDGLNITRYQWTTNFAAAAKDNDFNKIEIPKPTNVSREITALAVNKDGIFVAVKDTILKSPGAGAGESYTLKVLKYGKDKTPQGECTVVPETEAETFQQIGNEKTIDFYEEQIEALQVKDGDLYAITVKQHYHEYIDGVSSNDTEKYRKMSGYLYKIQNIDDTISGDASEIATKEADEASHTSYGFYRFNAIKPKKLVIASDAGWKWLESGHEQEKNTKRVVTYDLTGSVSEAANVEAKAKFSKQFSVGVGEYDWNPSE